MEQYIDKILDYDTTKGNEGLVAMFSADELEEMYDFISDTYNVSLFEEEKEIRIVFFFIQSMFEAEAQRLIEECDYDKIKKYMDLLTM